MRTVEPVPAAPVIVVSHFPNNSDTHSVPPPHTKHLTLYLLCQKLLEKNSQNGVYYINIIQWAILFVTTCKGGGFI